MRLAAVVAVVVSLLIGCADQPAPEIAAEPAPVTGPWLGQQPPGDVPELFLATALAERDTAWTPDGRQLVYSLFEQRRGFLVTRALGDDGWSAPAFADFSGEHSDLEPFITVDGAWLYFISQRPLPGETEAGDWNIWRVPRTGTGWGEPEPLPEPVNTGHQEFYPTLTAAGRLCFTSDRPGGLGGEDLWCAEPLDDGWAEPVNLGPEVNSPGPEYNSLVAPDGAWIIFGAARDGDVGGGDLHIAFRGPDGAFAPSLNMGEPINTADLDYCPALSPDGSILFFTSSRVPADAPTAASYEELESILASPANGRDNIWWVPASVIDRLRPEHSPAED
ncbi:MAG TPA: hypothetical protein VLT32_19865 [Candidatus Sulfomarinibacteraceae bacterium]|nr:hypothetical protein [Candidatus Sulfomarinibacteraceae bacterium]